MMNGQIDNKLRSDLSKAIQNVLRQECAQIFSKPVDYVALGILDYPEIIKQPMDLSTLKNKLESGEYVKIQDFLLDAALIFDNCRLYNGNSADGLYMDLAQQCEDELIDQFTRLTSLKSVRSNYYKLTSKAKGKEFNPIFSIQKIQNLVLKMQQLSNLDLQKCIKWYCEKKDVKYKDNDLRVTFNTFDGLILYELDEQVDQCLSVKNKR